MVRGTLAQLYRNIERLTCSVCPSLRTNTCEYYLAIFTIVCQAAAFLDFWWCMCNVILNILQCIISWAIINSSWFYAGHGRTAEISGILLLCCSFRWTSWMIVLLGHCLLDLHVAWHCICAVLQHTVFSHAQNSLTTLHLHLTMLALDCMVSVVSLCISSTAVKIPSTFLSSHFSYLLVASLQYLSASVALCQRFAMKDHIHSHAR